MIRFVLLIILIIVAIAGIILWKRYSPSKEQYDMKKYYGIEKDGQVGITVDNKVVEAEGKLAGGKVYVGPPAGARGQRRAREPGAAAKWPSP